MEDRIGWGVCFFIFWVGRLGNKVGIKCKFWELV